MEAAVVKPKPRIRAAVRDRLNRFQLVHAAETKGEKNEEFVRLARLASISRAQLASIRRSIAKLKFRLRDDELLLTLNLGNGAPKTVFTVDQTEMIAIIRLLGVPVHLSFWMDVDWKKLESIGRCVNALTVLHDSPAFSAFVNREAPHLRVLTSKWTLLARLPSLDLERARIYGEFQEDNDLDRHKIHRLDVWLDQVISSSIKSLGLMVPCVIDCATSLYVVIEGFARRFPSLEDLHIVCKYRNDINYFNAYFPYLWEDCLNFRDRLNVPGLKRLFLTIKYDCSFRGTKADWFEQLKQVEPFHKATFTIDQSKKCVRMFLKHNKPRGPKPMFVLIKGDFRWMKE
ncbi:hypothetical protein M3Y99_01928600 [Aphelenchoides fujianensis]|nr:hypothetical protein M3Y99_01928600 [Aphelenchoides fujianensis]